MLFGEGKVESIGNQCRVKTDAVSVIEQVAILGF
jgi:hypothetical protein